MGGQFNGTRQLVAALVEPYVDAIDRERKLPDPVVDTLKEERLFSLWLPTEYGGPDLQIPKSLQVIEALSAANGAVGWCACTAAINNRLAAFLSPTAAKQIFLDN